MDFFEFIHDKKLIALIISIFFNVLFIILFAIFCFNQNNEEVSLNEVVAINNEEESVNEFYIEIKGAVKKPGVYLVNSDNIINDVVNMAEGFKSTAYTNNINLAKKVKEEMVIYIYTKSEYKKLKVNDKKEEEITTCICPEVDISNCTSIGSSQIVTENSEDNSTTSNETIINSNDIVEDNNETNENTSTIINLNTASKEELMTLSGIGESKANSIIEYRTTTKFTKIEDIMNISGIGDAIFAKIKDNITV